MADITDERLREIATSDPLVLAICAQMGEPSWADVRVIAAELLAARAEVAAVEAAISDRGVSERDCGLPPPERVNNLISDLKQCRCDLAQTEMEHEQLRAQLRADDERAWETLGKPEGTYSTTNVQRLCAEVERLRAELRRMSEWHDQIADTVPCDVAGPHYGIVEWHLKVLAERDAARADMREAMELLRAHGHPPTWLNLREAAEWNTRYGKLLKKHKETP